MTNQTESVIRIRPATLQDTTLVSGVLKEAALWLEKSGMPLWQEQELELESIAADVAARLFFLAEHQGNAAGVVKFQLEDAVVWPEAVQGAARKGRTAEGQLVSVIISQRCHCLHADF